MEFRGLGGGAFMAVRVFRVFRVFWVFRVLRVFLRFWVFRVFRVFRVFISPDPLVPLKSPPVRTEREYRKYLKL